MSHRKKPSDLRALELIKILVALPSEFPKERKISNYCAEYLRALGYAVSIIPTSIGRDNIVATYGKTEKYIGFYGHLDTVSPDKQYAVNPYVVVRSGDALSGLGVADMKGGITAILILAKYAAEHNLPVKIILGVDEENISEGAHDLINSNHLSDVHFLISAESGQVKSLDQPFSVCYGRRGRIAIKIKLMGKKAHAAESHKATNAVETAAFLITRLRAVSFPTDVDFGDTDLVVHEINGSTDSFSVPDECLIILSALTTPKVKHKNVLEKIRELISNLGIDASVEPILRKTPYSEAYKIDPRNKFICTIESEVFKPAGITPMFSESVADENIFASRLKIPVISMGPVGGGDHTAKEWVSLSSVDLVIDNYKKILNLFTNNS